MIITGLICFFMGLGAGAWVMFRLLILGMEKRCKDNPKFNDVIRKMQKNPPPPPPPRHPRVRYNKKGKNFDAGTIKDKRIFYKQKSMI